MSDWDEIKRLAAEFQRVQASDTSQRLSERNVHDLIKLVIDRGLIELIYTKDGKAVVTPNQLQKDIEDEIYANGGRMSIHDLATNLNVDYSHIERMTKELVVNEPEEYTLIPGQLIHSIYKKTISKTIQNAMLVHGQISIADFSKNLDLPPDFLLKTVKEVLPTVTEGFVSSQDGSNFYAIETMDRYKSIITGTLTAILKPTSVASLMKTLNVPEKIFMPIVDGLIKEGRIDAIIDNRQFVPSIHARQQNEYIDQFYSTNLYISYDIVSRMDIKQPKVFLRKRFPEGIALDTCFISAHLLSQVESLVEETCATNGWIDISTILPTAIEGDDVDQLLQLIFKKNKQLSTSCKVFDHVNVCYEGYIASCKQTLKNSMQIKAQEHLKSGVLVQYFFGGKLKEKKDKENERGKDKENEQPPKVAKEGESDAPSTPVPDPEPVEVKTDKKDKKVKIEDFDDSDDEHKGKKSKSRKSGGGAQGREIKQKSVKKKYVPGNKANQKPSNNSDDKSTSAKTPRSTRGRAARRAMSPERPSAQKSEIVQKQPLIFMNNEEIAEKLRIQSGGDGSEKLFQSIADIINEELNSSYEVFAKNTLDEFMRLQSEEVEEVIS